MPDPNHAPAHLVHYLALTTKPPTYHLPGLSIERQWELHEAQCRVWADEIWRQGFVAGAAQAAEWAATPTRVVVTAETMEGICSATGLPSTVADTPPAT